MFVPTQPWSRLATATGLCLTCGLVTALLMPRGPVTGRHALLLMAIALVTGLGSGLALRTRWVMLLAPVLFVAAFEVGRLDQVGPTVDGIHLGTTYGVLGFLVGRGFFLFLTLPPLLLGAAWGARRHRATRGRARQAVAVVTGTALVVLAVGIALPARVPAVLDASGATVPGSIAEITKVTLGGNEQWIQTRAASADNPVIVYIPGGPGQSDFAQSRALLQPLEADYVVVTWDQRGNGRSYESFDPAGITLEAAVNDLVELANHLRVRFDEQKVYLLGESWGTIAAVLAAQQHPELFHALISSGQMVDVAETDQLIYQDLLVWADAHDQGLATQLRGFGPPPYASLWSYSVFLENYPRIEGAYTPPQSYRDRHTKSGVGFFGVMGSELPPVQKMNLFRGLMDTFDVLYPQLQHLDFRRDVPTLQVPIYFFNGAHELRGRSQPLMEWYAKLQAPDKQMYTYQDAGHAVAFEHLDDVREILEHTIIPRTYVK